MRARKANIIFNIWGLLKFDDNRIHNLIAFFWFFHVHLMQGGREQIIQFYQLYLTQTSTVMNNCIQASLLTWKRVVKVRKKSFIMIRIDFNQI